MRESKDRIKSRMLRNAARIWGYQDSQPDTSFDPVVGLLLGACAFELEKISREVNNTESRIVERLVNILTPQPITNPHPAHAVAFVKPTRKKAGVFPDFQFYINKKVTDQSETKAEEKQVYFSPAGTYSLTDGRVRYLAAHSRIYEFVDDQYKDIVAEMPTSPLSPSSIFIGLEMNEKLDNHTLFFNIISEHLKQTFYRELESGEWKIGNYTIKASIGLKDIAQQDHDVYHMMNREFDLSTKVSYMVNLFYNHQFVTLDLKEIGEEMKDEVTSIPDALSNSVGKKDLENLDKNTIWIELHMTSPLTDELIESISCSLNCFPVINRRKNEFTGSTRELVNIIPLHTDDVFFDLKSVSNRNGEHYNISHFENMGDLSKGSALLRLNGVGRFDDRNAMEYLEYLLELLKEESAAFNVIGSDMISSNLRELNQAIARLEKKIEDVQLEKGDTAYLMLKPQEGDRQVFVEFWSTNCSFANNIRAGTPINIYQANDLDYNSSRLMTTTILGREKPSTEDRINTYRRALLSGQRIVTKEDIKAVCFENFGESLSKVHIEKGIDKGGTKTEGFIRTIDIYLTIEKGIEMSLVDQNAMKQKLQVMLEAHSSNILPYRIFIRK